LQTASTISGQLSLSGSGDSNGELYISDYFPNLRSVSDKIILLSGSTATTVGFARPGFNFCGDVTTTNFVELNNNVEVQTVDLTGLTSAGELLIENNNALTTIIGTGFERTTGGGDFEIENNPVLTAVDFPDFVYCDDDFYVRGNSAVTSISFGASTFQISGAFRITNSPDCTSVSIPNMEPDNGSGSVFQISGLNAGVVLTGTTLRQRCDDDSNCDV